MAGIAGRLPWFQIISRKRFELYPRSPTIQRGTHGSVVKPDASGKSTNVLEVRVAGDTINYVVNGQTVHTMPKGTTKTDGLVGFRVNHMLDVQVEGFQVTKG